MIARVVRQCCSLAIVFLCLSYPALGAEKLVGLQSAPSIAMALPWFAEEARLHPKYDLDFQLVYIASSGIAIVFQLRSYRLFRRFEISQNVEVPALESVLEPLNLEHRTDVSLEHLERSAAIEQPEGFNGPQ